MVEWYEASSLCGKEVRVFFVYCFQPRGDTLTPSYEEAKGSFCYRCTPPYASNCYRTVVVTLRELTHPKMYRF